MAYNKKNKLTKTIEVQKHFKQHYVVGMTIEHVYKNHIFPTFHISRTTFYKYMNVAAEKELQKIVDNEQNKPVLKQIAMEFTEPVDEENN